ILFVWWFVFGTAAAVVWRARGGSTLSGFVIGFLFGIFGLGYVLLATPSQTKLAQSRERAMYRECPFCREPMRRDASVCPHCHRDVEPEHMKPEPSRDVTTVKGSALGLPGAFASATVETSGQWWRAFDGAPWRRTPYVDRYGNPWNGTAWLRDKRPESERWSGADPAQPAT